MTKPIYIYGTDILSKKGNLVPLRSDISTTIQDLFDTMYHAEGIGLAAPQAGLPLNLFVIDDSPLAQEYPDATGIKMVFINAEILWYSEDTWTYNEGCLSLPDFNEDIVRSKKIKIRYFDETWAEHEREFEGITARIIQHEYDHTQGKTIVERLSPLRRQLVKPRLYKRFKNGTTAKYATVTPK